MWPLILGFGLLALAGLFALPLPLWTTRALRRRRPRLALPPAAMEAGIEAQLDPDLVAVAREARIVAALVPRAEDSVTELLSIHPFVSVLGGVQARGQEENWAQAAVATYYRRTGEVARLFTEWAKSVVDLPEGADRVLRDRGFDPTVVTAAWTASSTTALAPRHTTSVWDGVPSREELQQTRDDLRRWFSLLGEFLVCLSRGRDPYR